MEQFFKIIYYQSLQRYCESSCFLKGAEKANLDITIGQQYKGGREL
jgi:hypothetical protein